jgi:group I intron endonuclease
MLLLFLINLVISTSLASVYLSSIYYIIAFLILDGLLSYNTLYVTPSLTWVHLLGGLLELSQYLPMPDAHIALSILVPVMIYHDAEIDKSRVIEENKGKAGIYLWTHKESNKLYVGSAVDLSKRLRRYYILSDLEIANNYISRAIIHYTHSAFFLFILEYIDISKLSKKETRELILEREQHYIDSLLPEYNILKVAGSSLGYKHLEESLLKMSLTKSGENHPRGMQGKTHSEETLLKMSSAKLGNNNPMFGKIGENHPMYGKIHSEQTLLKMSSAKLGENHPLFMGP